MADRSVETAQAEECGSCGEAFEDKCSKSQRPCGHHCNHIWTHEHCDWCGVTFGEDGEPTYPPEMETRDGS